MTHAAGGAGGEVETDLMPGPPVSSDTLEEAALKVLRAGDPWLKSEYGATAAQLWMDGRIERAYDENTPPLPVPSRPARLPTVSRPHPFIPFQNWNYFFFKVSLCNDSSRELFSFYTRNCALGT
jgi:hypothetical protein